MPPESFYTYLPDGVSFTSKPATSIKTIYAPLCGKDALSVKSAITPFLSGDIKIDKFIIYDRLRDENGCVIKENKVINKYNEWYTNNENEKYVNICNNNNISNSITLNPFTSIFSNMNDMDYINNIFIVLGNNIINLNNIKSN